MIIDCDFEKNIILLKNYFANKLGFISIEGENIYENIKIENEVHLINRNNNVYIDIIKYKNDNDIELTINGNSVSIDNYSNYIDYFLNKKLLQKAGKTNFIMKIDKELQDEK